MATWTAQAVQKVIERNRSTHGPTRTHEVKPLFDQKIIIALPYLLPGLNGGNGLIRQNRFKAAKIKDQVLLEVKAQRKSFAVGPVNILCTRYYAGTPMDFDNAASSFKYFMDAVVKAGIIADDGPECVQTWTIKQVKVPKRSMQKMEIEITKPKEQ